MGLFERITGGDADEGDSDASDTVNQDPKKNLAIHSGNYDLNFPHNTEEAEEAWESETPVVAEDLLREYEQMSKSTAVGNLIANTRDLLENANSNFTDETIVETINSERSSLETQISKMKQEVELEENEEQELESWDVRIDRFLKYLEHLYQQLPNDLSQVHTIQNDILLGGGNLGANPAELPGNTKGLDIDQDDNIMDEMSSNGITTDSLAMDGSTYGAGHAIEDLEKLYSKNLSPFLDEDGDELKTNVELLENFSQNLKAFMRTFNSLMHVRVNLAQLEEEENLEENLVRRFKSNSHMDTGRVEKALLGELAEEQDEIESLETTSEQLIRNEKWMIEHLEEAHKILERMFSMEDRLAAEEENAAQNLEGVGGNMPVSDLLKKLQNNSRSNATPYFERLTEDYLKVVEGIDKIHDIDSQEINNIVRIGAKIEKTLDIIGTERKIEREVEADVVNEVDNEAEIEIRLDETVESRVDKVYQTVPQDVDLRELFSGFEDRKNKFRESIEKLEDNRNPDKELKDEEKIAEKLEVIDEVFEKVKYQVQGKDGHPTFGTEVSIKVEHDSVDQEFDDKKAKDVIKWCLSHLKEIDEAVDTEVGENDEEYLQMIADTEERLSRFKHLENAAKKAEKQKLELQDELNQFPEDPYQSDGMEDFKDKLGLIGDHNVEDIAGQFEDKKEAKNLIEGAEYTLNQIDEDDIKEIEAIKRASEIDGDLDEIVKSLIRAAEEEDSSTRMVQGLKRVLNYVEDIQEEEQMLAQEVETQIKEIEK